MDVGDALLDLRATCAPKHRERAARGKLKLGLAHLWGFGIIGKGEII